mgnify:CR=1 FL=1|tara:strand:- start:2180 stop:2965 length:786 start_codon:yes stop_codon:yes gene_type:complete
MEKILYILGLAVPLLATSVSASSLSEEARVFFADETAALTVIRYSGEESSVRARLKGTLRDTSYIGNFDVDGKLEDKGWKNNDAALKATALKLGNVEVGRDDFVRLPGIYGDPIDYAALDDTEELQGDLIPGVTVSVKAVQNWLRPDKTTYSIVGDTLFRLRLEETRENVGGEFKVLISAREEIKCRGLKSKKATRYNIQNHRQEKVTLTTKKLAADSEAELEEPTIVEFIALTQTGTYQSWDNEAGRAQGVVPEGYRVIG